MIKGLLRHTIPFLVALSLAGCASGGLPDWVDPTTWFGDDDDAVETDVAVPDVPPPSAPTISSVPDRPTAISTPAERERLARELSDPRYDEQDVFASPERVVAARNAPAPVAPSFGVRPPDVTQLPNLTGTPGSGTAPGIPTAARDLDPASLANLPGGTPPVFLDSEAAPLDPEIAMYVPGIVIDSAGPRPAGSTSWREVPAGYVSSPRVAGLEPVETIYFLQGSSNLSDTDMGKLERVADQQLSQGRRVRIIGHASSRTRDMTMPQHNVVNFDISRDRAEAIAGELVRQGVSPTMILVEARADGEPVSSEIMPQLESANRRAEIFLE